MFNKFEQQMASRVELSSGIELSNEAFHYIDKSYQKVVVVKYGGSAMDSEESQKLVLKDVVTLKNLGLRPVLVHGGGKEISKCLSKPGVTPTFVQGYRKTDSDTIKVVEMVLNRINEGLVNSIRELGGRAVGISGNNAGLLHARKKVIKRYDEEEKKDVEYDIGYVGEIDAVNAKIITGWLDKDYIPVICPVGYGDNHEPYNINADDAACAVAKAMQSEKLAFLSDVPGIYQDRDDPASLISELDASKIDELLSSGKIVGGMIPKLKSCQEAIQNGVKSIHIMNAKTPQSLLLEVLTDNGVGTMIRGESKNSPI